MSKRREFTRDTRVEIVKRSMRDGRVHCEKCGCAPRRWEVDHVKPDGMETDKSRRLTAADGWVLCAGKGSCHAEKTAADYVAITDAKRTEAKHLRVQTRPAAKIRSAGFAKSAKAAARAETGQKTTPPRRLLPGWVAASDRKP